MIFNNRIRVERIRLDINKFKGVLSPATILLLSDLHISKFSHRERKLIHLINREQPDIILITGDLLPSYAQDFSACIQTLRKLNAPFGIFTVLGNADHTLYPADCFKDFLAALCDNNLTLLNNKSVALTFNGQSLYLIGVDDPFFRFDNFDEAMKDVPHNAPTILLAHSPDILYPRSDALVINLLDSPCKKDYFKDWGWKDCTQFSPDRGDIYFQNNGIHTMRVQSRQDGVSLDTILLNPYQEINSMLTAHNYEKLEIILTTENLLKNYPDLVIIPASRIDDGALHGKWKKVIDPSTLFNVRLDDLPPQKNWHFQPQIHPKNYFESPVFVHKGVRYTVWIRMKAYRGRHEADSVYLQFSNSVDKLGRERYRIREPAHDKERLREIDLILTGHTHGGQIRIPFFGPLTTMTSLGSDYASGLYHFGQSTLYVSRGIGTSKLPIRLFCPPEITVFNFT